MNQEGVIKFNSHWIKEAPLSGQWIEELNAWRDRLYKLNLIGVTKEGIGYGNISTRFQQHTFIITGSGTGKLAKLTAAHYTRVTAYNVNENSLTTTGPIQASSESLTHAMLYECDESINAVFHVHHLELWRKLLSTLPATSIGIEYGTTAMALEIRRLYKEADLSVHKLFAMAGHEEGIVSFGKNPDEAGQILLNQLQHL
ncbi:MAG: class II aldolase/adducin family protein [Flavisolibacter sp.]|nr:class II aldolase/adducin family protein [Flavisolibacter sp.]MBD0284735.1 class II aldolase/adducin family protein [Flavisolibacter sp.]